MSFSFPSGQAVEACRHKGEEGAKERKALVVQRQFLCSLSPYIFTEPTSEPALHLATGKRKKTSTQVSSVVMVQFSLNLPETNKFCSFSMIIEKDVGLTTSPA